MPSVLTSAEASVGRNGHDQVLLRPVGRIDTELSHQRRCTQLRRPRLQVDNKNSVLKFNIRPVNLAVSDLACSIDSSSGGAVDMDDRGWQCVQNTRIHLLIVYITNKCGT